MDVSELETSMKRLRKARDEIKRQEEIANDARDRIIEFLGVGVGTIDGEPVVMVTENTRKHFDQASLRKEHPRIHARFVTESEFITVRLIGKI